MIIKNVNSNGFSSSLIFMLAIICGSIVANIYYTQTLVILIGNYLHLNIQLTGLIVTLTQIGYCLGLLFIVPLADIIENKRLIIGLLLFECIFLFSIAFAPTSIIFLVCCFLLGFTSVAAQIIIPLVAHFTPQEKRGKAVGNIMSGVLVGVMLARPIASCLTDILNWQAIFIFSAVLMLIVSVLLFYILPIRKPSQKVSYIKLIYSLPIIFLSYPLLQRRIVYQSMLFCIFSLFWTSISILLVNYYHYSQTQIGLFALVGAAGALVAPIAGRLADNGYTKPATCIAIVMIIIACILAKYHNGKFIIILSSALLLDAGVSLNLVLGQRTIYNLGHEIRGRLNGVYMAVFFIGGSIGSGLSGYLYSNGGWDYITNTGIVIAIMTFIYFLSETYYNKKLNQT